MNIEDVYKQKESSKIFEEINQESAYQKDLANYNRIGFASGFVTAMKFMSSHDRKLSIESLKVIYDKDKDTKDCKWMEYIFRLYNDEFKAIEF